MEELSAAVEEALRTLPNSVEKVVENARAALTREVHGWRDTMYNIADAGKVLDEYVSDSDGGYIGTEDSEDSEDSDELDDSGEDDEALVPSKKRACRDDSSESGDDSDGPGKAGPGRHMGSEDTSEDDESDTGESDTGGSDTGESDSGEEFDTGESDSGESESSCGSGETLCSESGLVEWEEENVELCKAITGSVLSPDEADAVLELYEDDDESLAPSKKRARRDDSLRAAITPAMLASLVGPMLPEGFSLDDEAMGALSTAAEEFIVRIFHSSNRIASNSGRTVIFPRDLILASTLIN